MIEYSNIKRYDNLPFEEYLKLPGYSNSFLKGEKYGEKTEISPTDIMKVGKYVDAILTDPGKVDMLDPLYKIAQSVAFQISWSFGAYIKQFKSQISYTADLSHMGYKMPVTGRLDWLLEGFAVIDLKITKSKDLPSLISFMKYPNQVWNYANMAKVPNKYLMIHSIPLNKTELFTIKDDPTYNEFWASKILKLGTPYENEIIIP